MTSSYRTTCRDVNSFFCLMKNPLLCRSDSAGEQSGGAQEVPYGAVRSNLERAAPSACVGKRFRFVQIVWNRSTRRAGERGGARVGRPRWLRVLTITGGSSMPVLTARISLKPARLTRKRQ